jgi:D-arabinose 1-dehydrogenase-like Zn-dependent alcohol dehydrogenase
VARPWPRCSGAVHTAMIAVHPGGWRRSPLEQAPEAYERMMSGAARLRIVLDAK